MAETSAGMTRGEQMLALRRRRMAASHPFFRGGFRPFFFGGASWALIALTLWICALTGAISLPTALDPLVWHRHEMLFGFVGAIVGGFLLTAVPNWTGRLPIAGWPLGGLFGLWVAARLALLFSATIGIVPAALLDVGFFLVLGLLAAREVLEANNRNIPIVGMILLFGAADLENAAYSPGKIVAAICHAGWMLASANILRGPVDAADFKTYIFPLLFFKRICDVWDEEQAAMLAAKDFTTV